jgi:hypothetical protein
MEAENRDELRPVEVALNPTACWLWLGTIDADGYGVTKRRGRQWKAHRWLWTIMRGPIPDGLVVDHLCRVRRCVNPNHMELVPNELNTQRGEGWAGKNLRKTHCKYGHPFDLLNTHIKGGERVCLTCRREQAARTYRTKPRPAYPITCQYCGVGAQMEHKLARFCSKTCYMHAYYSLNRERLVLAARIRRAA